MDDIDQLMRRIQQGSEEALSVLIVQGRRPMELLAEGILGDRALADDAVQESLLILWRNRAQYDPSKPAWPWIARIVRNQCYQQWRRRRGRRKHPVGEVSLDLAGYVHCPQPRPETDVERAECLALVRERIHRLPPPLREVLQLSLFEEWPEARIARMLGIRPGTVKSRKHRALAMIREGLAE